MWFVFLGIPETKICSVHSDFPPIKKWIQTLTPKKLMVPHFNHLIVNYNILEECTSVCTIP